jgi:hypothetical protein
MFVSALVATIDFDKTKLEYIENSGTLLNDKDEIYAADEVEENNERNEGFRALYITITEENAHTKDGRVFKATFKKLTDEPVTIALNNDFRSLTGYASYPMFTTKADSGLEFADVIYDGKNLNLIKTPLVIE